MCGSVIIYAEGDGQLFAAFCEAENRLVAGVGNLILFIGNEGVFVGNLFNFEVVAEFETACHIAVGGGNTQARKLDHAVIRAVNGVFDLAAFIHIKVYCQRL